MKEPMQTVGSIKRAGCYGSFHVTCHLMRRLQRGSRLIIYCALLLGPVFVGTVFGSTLIGGPYAITQVDINCGGTHSTAGVYALTASTGQPLEGGITGSGPYQASDGFWPTAVAFCGDVTHAYPAGDFFKDCYVNWADFGVFASRWLDICDLPDWCAGVDMDKSGQVNWADFAVFASHWQECTDPSPPCNYNP